MKLTEQQPILKVPNVGVERHAGATATAFWWRHRSW